MHQITDDFLRRDLTLRTLRELFTWVILPLWRLPSFLLLPWIERLLEIGLFIKADASIWFLNLLVSLPWPSTCFSMFFFNKICSSESESPPWLSGYLASVFDEFTITVLVSRWDECTDCFFNEERITLFSRPGTDWFVFSVIALTLLSSYPSSCSGF